MRAKTAIKPLIWIAALALGMSNAFGGNFKVGLRTDNLGVGGSVVTFRDDMSNGSYLQAPSPSVDTWTYDSGSNKISRINVNPNATATYTCPLQYNGVPDGNTNMTRFVSTTPYNSNILITYRTDHNGKTEIGDCRKLMVDANTNIVDVGSEAVTNGNRIYGTNWVNIAPIETTVRKLDYDSGANECNLQADVRPGTITWPEYTDDLTSGSWTAITNSPHKKYTEVTTNNFGGLERVTWGNLPGNPTNGMRFWRIQNVVYDPAYTNGLGGGFEENGFSATTRTPTAKTSTYPKSLKAVLKLK